MSKKPLVTFKGCTLKGFVIPPNDKYEWPQFRYLLQDAHGRIVEDNEFDIDDQPHNCFEAALWVHVKPEWKDPKEARKRFEHNLAKRESIQRIEGKKS